MEIKGEEKEGEFICTCVCMKVYMYICMYVCMYVAVVYMRKVANITVILLVQKCMRRVCVHTLVECLIFLGCDCCGGGGHFCPECQRRSPCTLDEEMECRIMRSGRAWEQG